MRAGSCLTRRHLPKKMPKKKRLTHHAVINILTFIRRWREILIQPCFTDSVALTTQIHPHIDRISGVRSRIPVKLNTITINGFNIENFDLLRFPTGKRNHPAQCLLARQLSDHHQRNRRQNVAPIFRDSVHLAPNLPGNRPCRYASP